MEVTGLIAVPWPGEKKKTDVYAVTPLAQTISGNNPSGRSDRGEVAAAVFKPAGA